MGKASAWPFGSNKLIVVAGDERLVIGLYLSGFSHDPDFCLSRGRRMLEFSLMLQPYATKFPGFMGGLPKAV